MSDTHTIPPRRLLEAVDALYAALDEMHAIRFTRRPSRLMGTPEQPEVFCDFTPHEIRAAETFLERCGLLDAITHGNHIKH